MDINQLMGQMRQLVPILGTTLVAVGVWNASESAVYQTIILNILGGVTLIIGSILSLRANSKSSIVAAASKMTEIPAMTITDPKLAEVARAADPNTVVKDGGITK